MSESMQDKPLVLVTGSTGLIGSRILQHLSGDFTLLGLDVKEAEEQWPGSAWLYCDLTKDESVEDVLSGIRKDYGERIASVVHLAAYYDFSGEPSPMYDKLTVQGTRRLIHGLQRHFDCIEQFIFASSLLVMKPADDVGEKLTEASPTQAEWDYPQSKLRTERLLRNEHREIPIVILRLAGAYDEDCHSLPLSQHIRRIYEKLPESYVFPGDADHGQPFVHLDDVTRCFRAAIVRRRELRPSETFLIAEPDAMSHRDLQEELGRLIHGTEWPTLRIPKAVAKAGARIKEKLADGRDEFIKPWMIDLADDLYPVEIRRAREKLRWEPRHRLRDTLPQMIERFKRHPEQWYETNNLPMPDALAR